MHILGSLLGYLFLTLAAVYASLLLFQIHWLKKPARWSDKIQPIEKTQGDMLLLLRLGFVFLTLGVIVGFATMQSIHRGPVLSTLGAWLLYVILLIIQHRKGLAPRWAGMSVICGWLFLTFAYFGTKLISGYH